MNASARRADDPETISQVRIRVGRAPDAPGSPFVETSHLLVQDLLDCVDGLDAEATGALVFGPAEAEWGAVLVEKGRVCWALARGMNKRLTDLLHDASERKLDAQRVEELVGFCRRAGRPLGEVLVERGWVGSDTLRRTLRQQTIESISLLAASSVRPRWLSHKKRTYDPTYSFSTGELLGAFGALRCPALAARARVVLDELLEDTAGAVFTREGGSSILVGLSESLPLTVAELRETIRWAHSEIDVASVVTSGFRLVSAADRAGRAIVAWQDGSLSFVALCPDARILARVLGGASRR